VALQVAVRALVFAGLAVVCAAALTADARPVSASVTVKEYRKILSDKATRPLTRFQLLAQHIGGVFEGFEWVNAYLRARRLAPVFCRPRGVKVTRKLLLVILESELRRPSVGKSVVRRRPRRRLRYGAAAPIEGILLAGLRARWPCKR